MASSSSQQQQVAPELLQLLQAGVQHSLLGMSVLEVEAGWPGGRSTELRVSSDDAGVSLSARQQPSLAGSSSSAGFAAPSRFLYVNPALEALTGYTADELQRGGLSLLLSPDSPPSSVHALHTALSTCQPLNVDLLCLHKSGQRFWSALSLSPAEPASEWRTYQQQQQPQQLLPQHHPPHQGSAGANSLHGVLSSGQEQLSSGHLRPGSNEHDGGATNSSGVPSSTGLGQRFLALFRDITAAKLSEAGYLLRDQALDAIREGVTVADLRQPDEPIIYANQAFVNLTGYTKQEVLGRNCRFLQGTDTDRAAVSKIRQAIAKQELVDVQLLNHRKDGSIFHNHLTLKPVADPETGIISAYIGVQRDVSELEEHKEAQEQLRLAKQAAESHLEAKSMFVANMSHEIRTPLNGMLATAQLLLSSPLSPEQRELTETILDSGSALLGVLGDILDFSKLDHGSVELQQQPVCLRQVAESCLEMVAAEACRKGLHLAYLMDERCLERPLLADPVRVRQILANLLSNAVKFTESGEVVVSMSVEPAASSTTTQQPSVGSSSSQQQQQQQQAQANPTGTSEDVLHIAVRDTGIGIGTQAAKHLFEHFRQGSETMSRRYGGLGLGLAISRRLAELMRGTIYVESEGLGCGSTFHVKLAASWVATSWASGAGPLMPSSPAPSVTSSDGCPSRTSLDLPSVASSSIGPGRGAASASAAAGGDGSGPLDVAEWRGDASLNSPISSSVASGSGLGLSAMSSLAQQLEADRAAAASCSSGATSVAFSCNWHSDSGYLQKLPASMAALATDGQEPLQMLSGLRVLVDVSHAATAMQVCQSCCALGMHPAAGSSTTSPVDQYDIAVVSVDRSVPALKSGWKGRPVVSIGDSALLPSNLHPLVVFTPAPVRHARLSSSLTKATALLKVGQTPNLKLGHIPITAESLQMIKSWRFKKADLDGSLNRRTSLDNSALERSAWARAERSAPPEPSMRQATIPENSEVHGSADTHHLHASTAAAPPPYAPPLPAGGQHPPLYHTPATSTASAASQAPPPPPGSPSPTDTPLRILIAEDNKINQKVVLKVLQQILKGCVPDVVENGLQVLRALETKKYDLILMDIHMPEMDGLEASKRIRETYRPEERPRIIALSADTVQALHDRCREAGIEAFLTKPFRIEDLRKVMKVCHRVPRREGSSLSGTSDLRGVGMAC